MRFHVFWFAITTIYSTLVFAETVARATESFESIMAKNAATPEAWREPMILGRFKELVGDMRNVTPSELAEIQKIVTYLSNSKTATEASNLALIDAKNKWSRFQPVHDNRHIKRLSGTVSIAEVRKHLEPFNQADSAAEDLLMSRAAKGHISSTVFDRLIAQDGNSPTAFTIALVRRSKMNPAKQELLFKMIDNVLVLHPTGTDLMAERSFRDLCDIFAAIDVDDAKYSDRLKRLVADSKHPERAAALIVSNPNAFAKLDLRLGVEFLTALTKDDVQEAFLNRAVSIPILESLGFSEAEIQAALAKASREQKLAYRFALGNVVSDVLKKAAEGNMSEVELDRAYGALKVARASFDEADFEALKRISRMALPDGPPVLSGASSYFTVKLRSFATEALAGALTGRNDSDAQLALIDILEDPDPEPRMFAVDGLKKANLSAAAQSRFAEVVAGLEARGLEPATYLHIKSEELQALRQRMIRVVPSTASIGVGVSTDCAPDFAAIAKTKLVRVK